MVQQDEDRGTDSTTVSCFCSTLSGLVNVAEPSCESRRWRHPVFLRKVDTQTGPICSAMSTANGRASTKKLIIISRLVRKAVALGNLVM